VSNHERLPVPAQKHHRIRDIFAGLLVPVIILTAAFGNKARAPRQAVRHFLLRSNDLRDKAVADSDRHVSAAPAGAAAPP
jgi:hypothetical protein